MPNTQDFRKLSVKRGSYKARLTAFKNFLEKSIQNADNADLKEVKNRLSAIKGVLNEFLAIQLEIEYLVDEDVIENEYTNREDFENNFHALIARAESFLEQNDPSCSAITPNNSNISNDTLNQHVVDHLARINVVDDNFAGIKLPTINLPSFSGEPTDWLQFKDSFDSLIIQNNKISNIQKFHYLKRALEGEAFEIIANITVCNDNFVIAWDLLCEQFTDKRALLHVHTKALYNIEAIRKESSKTLNHLVDHVRMHLRSLQALGEPTSSWDTLIIYLVTSKLDPVTIREWESKDTLNDIPKLEDLLSFLKQKAKMLKKMEDKITETPSANNSKSNPKKNPNSMNKYIPHNQRSFHTSLRICPACKSSKHRIYSCSQFSNLPITERINLVKSSNLCPNCLNFGHELKNCNFGHCRKCTERHHSLIHTDSEMLQPNPNLPSTSIHQSLYSFNLSSKQVLLATVLIEVVDSEGVHHDCRALLDPGSQSNFITSSFCHRLGLKTDRVNITISGAFKVESKVHFSCNINLFSKHTPFAKPLFCLVTPDVCDIMPESSINLAQLSIPTCHKLADPEFHVPKPIDLLIGADLFWESLCIGQVKLQPSGPFLHKTKFGWIVAGPLITNTTFSSSRMQCNLSQNVEVQNQLARFWEIEECANRIYSPEEKACENNFLSTHCRDTDGRFIVTIPLKEPVELLGDSRATALKRFFNLERRLQQNSELRSFYIQFMREYENLGHMSKLNAPNDKIQFFLPHHGVLKADSLSTKLRVVFDGSCSSTSGVSLNDLQMVGPSIQNDLFTILLRFRMHSYVVSADICKMYRQVLINPLQRNLQQIFWREQPSDPLSIFQLNTVTYGTSSASFLAIRSVMQLAAENESLHPIPSEIIKNDFYVDDLLTGSDSCDELAFICKEISSILLQGCFNLRKWISNEPKILQHVCDSTSELNVLNLGENENTKTLGVIWYSSSDHLAYRIDDSKIHCRITKRTILSSISQIFDPLGLLSPCIIIAKILLQKLWLQRLSWDESVSVEIHTQWIRFRDDLNHLNNFKIPRHVRCQNPIQVELHTFSDASESAYGACAYIRSLHQDGTITVHLLCAKSKVAPLKSITVPRLELCGALIAARLSFKILKNTRVCYNKVFHWTDSTIVLGWINTSSSSLKTFVSNRISEIQEKTSSENWFHVNSASNPADLLSRGTNPFSLMSSKLWWHGADWLSRSSSNWPESLVQYNTELPDVKVSQVLQISVKPSFLNFQNFSIFLRLVRSTAYVFRACNNFKIRSTKLQGPLQADELSHALHEIVKIVQAEHFSSEIAQLKKHQQVVKKSKIQSLSPFLDDNGVIRVGGRFEQSNLSFDRRHPILLPSKALFTKLLFRHEHLKLFHAGPNHLLASIRESYWPISGRSIARKTVHSCTICFRAKPLSKVPLMGNLPKERLSPAPPFYSTGLDYAGPFSIKERKFRGAKIYKGWVCLFICMVTKAIHLEIAADLTSDSFLSCFRRFISRRGKPAHIFSDNATNFTGAKGELDAMSNFFDENKDELITFCSNEGMVWKFIPAQSPHFGGLWEAGVKSMKSHLKRVTKNSIFTYDDFQTLIVQIEAILNSRPLSPLSSTPSDLNPITPSHFLIGRPLTALPEPDLDGIPENRLSCYQKIQKMQQNIWNRWSKEYISELQQRQKWLKSSPNVQPGQLVLIKCINSPPLCWPLGRIVSIFPGPDGVVRVVSVKTARGEYKRAVKNICPLPDN